MSNGGSVRDANVVQGSEGLSINGELQSNSGASGNPNEVTGNKLVGHTPVLGSGVTVAKDVSIDGITKKLVDVRDGNGTSEVTDVVALSSLGLAIKEANEGSTSEGVVAINVELGGGGKQRTETTVETEVSGNVGLEVGVQGGILADGNNLGGTGDAGNQLSSRDGNLVVSNSVRDGIEGTGLGIEGGNIHSKLNGFGHINMHGGRSSAELDIIESTLHGETTSGFKGINGSDIGASVRGVVAGVGGAGERHLYNPKRYYLNTKKINGYKSYSILNKMQHEKLLLFMSKMRPWSS